MIFQDLQDYLNVLFILKNPVNPVYLFLSIYSSPVTLLWSRIVRNQLVDHVG